MKKSARQFLFNYLDNASPTGFESSGQKIWLDYLKPYYHESLIDPYGTAVAILNPQAPYKVVIEAHADEIGWFVNYITAEGYLYVIRNGGSDHQIAPSKRVNIHTEKGIVKGIFGWPAIHVRDHRSAKEESPSLKNLCIDVGASSKKEVEKMGIHVGSVLTFEDSLFELNQKYWVGRGLDNRMGGFIIAETLRQLVEEKNNISYGLYVVNSVQEEIGLRGAEMISRRIKPDIALVTDVCHDTHSPMYDKKMQGDQKCGRGPVLTHGPTIHPKILDQLLQTCEKHKIPFQRAVSSRYTGTDTDAFAYSAEGVPSALISLPLKYMHTTVEMADKKDIENHIQLLRKFLNELKPEKK
ncbi:MAG: M42 family metallopeptidase [Cytophagales bacterium]|nr:M42 family metallopeptidase [Cytophagales bacterium]